MKNKHSRISKNQKNQKDVLFNEDTQALTRPPPTDIKMLIGN